MKYLLYLLCVVCGVSCNRQKTPPVTHEANAEFDPSKTYVFEGKLGKYNRQMMMKISFDGDSIIGESFYTKHQKIIDLSGTIDYVRGEAVFCEKNEGEVSNLLTKLNVVSCLWRI